MFNNILEFWKGKDFLTKVLEDFGIMLTDAENMYTNIQNSLINNQNIDDLKNKIYLKDKQINEKEKSIRKTVIEHLSIQPTVDISTSLILMSVVKDAERIGDYIKNLYEVKELLQKPINKETYTSLFGTIDEVILELFILTKKAFMESDKNSAERTWELKKTISSQCEQIFKELANSKFQANEAVCFTLVARYFKRISSHLTNIATSIIVPLSNLDYYSDQID